MLEEEDWKLGEMGSEQSVWVGSFVSFLLHCAGGSSCFVGGKKRASMRASTPAAKWKEASERTREGGSD